MLTLYTCGGNCWWEKGGCDSLDPFYSYQRWLLPKGIFSVHAVAASHEEGEQVTISEDAGLFVCNYTFYRSIEQSQRNSKQKWHSLFIHVPPFEVMGPEQQLSMAAAMLDSIAAAVAPVQGMPVVLGQEAAPPVGAGLGLGRVMLSCFSCCRP